MVVRSVVLSLAPLLLGPGLALPVRAQNFSNPLTRWQPAPRLVDPIVWKAVPDSLSLPPAFLPVPVSGGSSPRAVPASVPVQPSPPPPSPWDPVRL